MKFLIVDPHLYAQIKDAPGVILAWDETEIAERAHPPRRRRLEPIRARRRRRLTTDNARAFEAMKKDLYAL